MRRAVLVAAAFGVAALLGGAGEARAQACAIPDDAPEAVFDVYVDALGVLLPMPEAECEKFVKSWVAACHKAVSANVSCWNQLMKSLRKRVKAGCKLEGPDEAECNAVLGGDLDLTQEQIDESEADGHAICEMAVPEVGAACALGP